MTRQAAEVSASASDKREAVFHEPCPDRTSTMPNGVGFIARLCEVFRWARLRNVAIRSVDDLPDALRAELGLEAPASLCRPEGERE